MTDTIYQSHEDVREHARKAALAGKPIWANPHLGGDADLWFEGYRSVPEELRGSQPDLLLKQHRVRATRKRSMADAGIKALGDRALVGSTPRPMSRLSADEIATRIGYYERVLTNTTYAPRHGTAERMLVKLRAAVPAVPARTPRPWSGL
jgi:hypothetical protein